MTKLNWGILSTARIGVNQVGPAINASHHGRVTAVASRALDRAHIAADKLGAEAAYGSYEALLADPAVAVIYNALPNHMHLEWTIKAAEAGKHVLCEKPLGLNTEEAEQMVAARDRTGVRIQEGFMVRTHPQWLRVRDMIADGRIGTLCAIQGYFSYFNDNPDDIRNRLDAGGGGILDIGCYPTTTSRFVMGREPVRVMAEIERDPEMGTDRRTTAILDYGDLQASFTVSTQCVAYQRMQFFGTKGRIEVEIPFNAPNDHPCRLFVDDGSSVFGAGIGVIEIPTCDQYTVMADAFGKALIDGTPQPIPLEDSVCNMRVLDGLFRSAESGAWQAIG